MLVTAARLAIAGGRIDAARGIATELGARLPAQSRAYGKMIEAEILMAKQPGEARDAIRAALQLADLWLVRYVSGLVYFQAGDYPAAMSEFAKCQQRRGEATAIFLDDLPTYHYMATVPVLARTRARGRQARPEQAVPRSSSPFAVLRPTTLSPLTHGTGCNRPESNSSTPKRSRAYGWNVVADDVPSSNLAPECETRYARDVPSASAATSIRSGRFPSMSGSALRAASPPPPPPDPAIVNVALAVAIPAPGGSVTEAVAVELADVPSARCWSLLWADRPPERRECSRSCRVEHCCLPPLG